MNQPGKHVYYVAYAYPGGYGAIDIHTQQPIKTMQDVQAVQAEVNRIVEAKTLVLSWAPIEAP